MKVMYEIISKNKSLEEGARINKKQTNLEACNHQVSVTERSSNTFPVLAWVGRRRHLTADVIEVR